MSTPSWQRKGNTYCKYCQQWIRETPSEKRNHERSKHHVINVQKHINDQQILERTKQKEEQRNRKILDNIERKVKSSSDGGENEYYQAFLKHQQEMENLPSLVMESVLNNFAANQQPEDIKYEEPQQNDTVEEPEPSASFECNDLPLGQLAKAQPVIIQETPKKTITPKKKIHNNPTEIGSYYDDPNFFYYEQEEEEKKEEKEEHIEQTEQLEEIRKKQKPSSDWKNKFANTMTSSANTFGQWEIVKVEKVETGPATEIETSSNSVKVEHEEDQLGGTYNLSDSKKRKNEANDGTGKKVKTEDSGPRKPLSFSLSSKKK